MNSYQLYIVFSAIKDFVIALGETYFEDDNDAPLHSYLTFINMMSMTDKAPIEGVVESFKEYLLSNTLIKYSLDDEAWCDVDFYLKKEDENVQAMQEHLDTIKLLFHNIENNIVTEEERFLNEFVQSFVKSIDLPVLKEEKSKNTPEELIAKYTDRFKPNIEKSVDEFQAKNLNIDRVVKLICLKIKDFLTNNEIPKEGSKIDKDKIIQILDIAIQKDIEDLAEDRFKIIALLSSSGFLAHLPLSVLANLTKFKNEIDLSGLNIGD